MQIQNSFFPFKEEKQIITVTEDSLTSTDPTAYNLIDYRKYFIRTQGRNSSGHHFSSQEIQSVVKITHL